MQKVLDHKSHIPSFSPKSRYSNYKICEEVLSIKNY